MTVELIDQLGNDLSIVNAARVSLAKQSKELSTADKKLIGFLMRERHGSPFEHVVFSFRVRTPLKVAREWNRHRIASYNEESTRYSIARMDFYTPYLEDVRTQVGKPGAYTFAPADKELAKEYRDAVLRKHAEDEEFYTKWVAAGIAKELVSFELPMSTLTEFICTMNFRAATNFLSLRNDETALREIRYEALEVEELIKNALPVAYKAWIDNNRKPV